MFLRFHKTILPFLGLFLSELLLMDCLQEMLGILGTQPEGSTSCWSLAPYGPHVLCGATNKEPTTHWSARGILVGSTEVRQGCQPSPTDRETHDTDTSHTPHVHVPMQQRTCLELTESLQEKRTPTDR